jgi:hypothetical protein
MEPQRIILANVPRFLVETLQRALADVSGLQIVGEIADWAMLPSAIQRTGAQWVIVSLPSGRETSQAVEALLKAYPAIRLLNVATDGGHITLQWVEPRTQTIDDFSMRELVALLTSQPPIAMPAR